jgi:hypothetical protein
MFVILTMRSVCDFESFGFDEGLDGEMPFSSLRSLLNFGFEALIFDSSRLE